MSRYPINKSSAETEGPRLDGLAVDRDAEVPIGVQLGWVLRARIGAGELAPGQRLPGLRELAQAAGVNVNTARAVYQRLEQEGLIDSQQGSGTFVSEHKRSPSAARAIAADAADEARLAGVDPRDVGAALYVDDGTDSDSESRSDPGSGSDSGSGDDGVSRRRGLRTQIAALERTLGEMEASHPGLAPAPDTRAGAGPALLSAEQLEEVRTLLVRRLAAVQAAIDAASEPPPDEPPPPVRRTRSRKQSESSRSTAPKRARPRPGAARPAPGVG